MKVVNVELGVFDFIKSFKNRFSGLSYAKMLNGYVPIFSQFGQDIYYSDVVQQAINCITTEIKKLSPMHIRENGFEPLPVNGNIQKLLNDPNERMTISDFLEKVVWQLFLNYNCFIVPTYDLVIDSEGNVIKNYTGLYPIQPVQVEFRQDSSGKLFVYFRFVNGYDCTLAYDDVIHLRYRFSVNEFLGGNDSGQPDNKALLKTLELNDTLLQGVAKALKSSFSINGIVKYNTMMDDGKTQTALKQLENHLRNNESGFLPMDVKSEFIPIEHTVQMVDEATLKFIDSKILRHFGVSLPVLTGDYTSEQYNAFYQKTLEPLIIAFGQEFTKKLFTQREKSFGNCIKFYPHELLFLNTSQKIELFNTLVDTASCYKNELRTAFGLKPLPELAYQLAISSNKSNAINNEEGVLNAENKDG